ncbi:MAG: hypothetical protein ACREQZ_05920 [Woeseiaceae bacterium]
MPAALRSVDSEPRPRDAISLSIAAALALEKLERPSAKAVPGTAREEQLDRVAVAISVLVPIFKCDSGTGSFSRLTEEELARGSFRDGARRFVFANDERDIELLSIEKLDLNAAIDELLRSMK